MIAGFFVIDAKDVEAAIAVAKPLPIMDGAVEVRPLFSG